MPSGGQISPNARRWLDTISFAEGTWGGKAPRYAITFGYQPIADLSKHPDRVVKSGRYASAAAGAYQFMPQTWEAVRGKLGLRDFGPVSQDLGALELIRQRGVDPDRDPITRETLAKLSGEWASIPTLSGKSAYGQPVKSAEQLLKFAGSPMSVATSREDDTTPVDKKSSEGLGKAFYEAFLRRLTKRSGLDAPEIPFVAREIGVDTPVTREEIIDLFSSTKSDRALEDQRARDASLVFNQVARNKAMMQKLMENAQASFKINPIV
jgi:muramidase (phage lysozyme)